MMPSTRELNQLNQKSKMWLDPTMNVKWPQSVHFLSRIILWTLFSAAGAPAFSLTPYIVDNGLDVCVFDGARGHSPTCVTEVQQSVTKIPNAVKNVEAFSFGASHGCAVVRDRGTGPSKLSCWGQDQFDLASIPNMESGFEPKMLASSDFYHCVLAQNKNLDQGIRCWGNTFAGVEKLRDIRRDVQKIMGFDNGLCVYQVLPSQQKKVLCRGNFPDIDLTLSGPEWTAQSAPKCVMTGEKVECKPSIEPSISNPRPSLSTQPWLLAPVDMSTALTCTAKNNSVTCQGISFNCPSQVLSLAIVESNVYALHRSGLTRYDLVTKSVSEVPVPGQYLNEQLEIKNKEEVFGFLEDLSKYTYKFDSDLVMSVQSLLTQANLDDYAIVMGPVKLYIQSLSYESLSPRMPTLMSALGQVFPQESKAKPNLSLQVLSVFLSTAKPVLLRTNDEHTSSQVQRVEEAVAAIGSAMAQNAKLTTAQLGKIKVLADEFSNNPYVAARSAAIHHILDALD
jgi:hypothetical protein